MAFLLERLPSRKSPVLLSGAHNLGCVSRSPQKTGIRVYIHDVHDLQPEIVSQPASQPATSPSLLGRL